VDVSINATSIRRAAKKSEGHGVYLLFRSPGVQLIDQISSAIEASNAAQLDGTETTMGDTPISTRRGVVAWLSSCDSQKSLEAWLKALRSGLESTGWEGTVVAFTNDHTPYDAPGAHVHGMVAGIVRHESELLDASDRGNRWGAPDLIIDDSVRRAAAAILAGEGSLYLRAGTTQVILHAEDAIRSLSAAVRTAPWAALIRVEAGGGWIGAVFSPLGHVHFERYDPVGGWRAEFDVVKKLMIDHADVAEYGFVKRHWLPTVSWRDLIDGSPRAASVHGGYTQLVRGLESSRVPDAYGCQMLSSRHLANAKDLRAWRSTALNEELSLVEAEDLVRWYDGEEPQREVIENARGDFGEMILTIEEVAAAGRHLLITRGGSPPV